MSPRPISQGLGAHGRTPDNRPASRWPDAAIALVAGLILTAAALLRVGGDQVTWPDGTALGGLCWSRALLDATCPTCGLTRSVIALAHGDLGGSLAFHPGGVLVALMLLASMLGPALAAAAGRAPLSTRRAYRRAVEATALLCLAAGLARQVWSAWSA